MPACSHPGAMPCPHATRGGQAVCLWHNAAVTKTDAYVREVFQVADRQGHGRFPGAHLAGIDLARMRLEGRCFAGADLRDARFDGGDLSGADLSGADLRRTSFQRAVLARANLSGANLTGTSFVGADLREADLSHCRLDSTVLLAADLRGANLHGAAIVSFQWNRLTRFKDLKGIDSGGGGDGAGDETRVYLAPAAFGDLNTAARAALSPDPAVSTTHTYTRTTGSATDQLEPGPAARGTDALQHATGTPAPLPVRLRWPGVVLSGLGGVVAMGACWFLVARATPPTVLTITDPNLVAEVAGLKTQHDADLEQLRKQEDRARRLSDELASAHQAAADATAVSDQLRSQQHHLLADLARLSDAADRATVAQVNAGEWQALSEDLARSTAKQERVSRILADGVERTLAENQRLTTALHEASTKVGLLETTQAENVRLTRETNALRQDRDQAQSLYQTTAGELAIARTAIERYLGRIAGTQLEGILTDDHQQAPFLALTPGKALSLGGDYLVSLQVDPSAEGNALNVRLVVQRPAAAANPDATVVLYDDRKRPLRRLAASFPHVDAGAPFVSFTSAISCDRQPAYARVLLGPGTEEVAAR